MVALMGTDLVRHKDKWASGVKEMRDIFARLEGAGYSRESQMVRQSPHAPAYILFWLCHSLAESQV